MTIKPRHKAIIDACIDEIVHLLKGRAMHYNIKYNEKMLLSKRFIQSIYKFHEYTEDNIIKQLGNGLYCEGGNLHTGEIHVFTQDLLDCYDFRIEEKKVAKYLLEVIDTSLFYFKIKSISIGNTKYCYDKKLKTYKEFNG